MATLLGGNNEDFCLKAFPAWLPSASTGRAWRERGASGRATGATSARGAQPGPSSLLRPRARGMLALHGAHHGDPKTWR